LRDVVVVTECCTRRYGYLDFKAIEERPDELTTNDIRPMDGGALESLANDIDCHIADRRAELEAIRWVLAG
jgi:hypothetical protein